jgi:hypothetical protein
MSPALARQFFLGKKRKEGLPPHGVSDKTLGSTTHAMAPRNTKYWLRVLSLAAILFVMPFVTMSAQEQASNANEPKAIMDARDLNVNRPQAIPEPATYMLLGFGVLVCAQQFRKNRK